MSDNVLNGRRILFIGAGNMAEALVRGLLKAGACGEDSIRVADIEEKRLTHFNETYGVGGDADAATEARDADILVLSVKPQVMPIVLRDIGPGIPGSALVVSIAAGITIRSIESALGEDARLVRVMPNSPALVGCGAAAFACGKHATEDDARATDAIFRSVGLIVRVDEADIDAVTALSGSGPAYVFYLVEGMLRAAAEMGLDPAAARSLTVATVEGAARMLKETGLEPEELRRRVTSPGGTTAAAIKTLDEAGTGQAITKAVLAARARARELGR